MTLTSSSLLYTHNACLITSSCIISSHGRCYDCSVLSWSTQCLYVNGSIRAAYACSMELHQDDTRSKRRRLPAYVHYCMHRIRMLKYNHVTPVVVFDGGRLPLKAMTEQDRRRYEYCLHVCICKNIRWCVTLDLKVVRGPRQCRKGLTTFGSHFWACFTLIHESGLIPMFVSTSMMSSFIQMAVALGSLTKGNF